MGRKSTSKLPPFARAVTDFDRLQASLKHIPSWAAALRVTCVGCGHSIKPDLLEKRAPFVSIDAVGGGRWVRKNSPITCPVCGERSDLEFPIADHKGTYWFFGDEADRETGKRYLFTYSLVGAPSAKLPHFESAIAEFKKQHEPDRDPTTWAIHVMHIWAGHNRERHPVFSKWTPEKARNFLDELFDLIKGFDRSLWIVNIAGAISAVGPKKDYLRERNRIKREAYGLVVAHLVDTCTREGIVPQMICDSEKTGEGNKIIHQWASDTFHGSQVAMIWQLLSRGLTIPEPVFVVPASRPLLEIADVVSFVIARYVSDLLQNKKLALTPERISRGNNTYMAFDSTGGVKEESGWGYPFDASFWRAL